MRPFLNAVLAASLVLAPTASIAASPVPPTADPQARAGADLQNPNQDIEGNWWLIGGGIILLLILLLVLLDDDDEDAPVSP